jgi:hypothetical protein
MVAKDLIRLDKFEKDNLYAQSSWLYSAVNLIEFWDNLSSYDKMLFSIEVETYQKEII